MTFGLWGCKGSTRYSTYLEDYWLCAHGLSAVNVIGTHLRDPINSGLTRWCVVMGSLFGRAGSVTEDIVLDSGLVNGGRWSQDYCVEPRCYLVSVPQLMGILL